MFGHIWKCLGIFNISVIVCMFGYVCVYFGTFAGVWAVSNIFNMNSN